jgi:hypothetical protein
MIDVSKKLNQMSVALTDMLNQSRSELDERIRNVSQTPVAAG